MMGTEIEEVASREVIKECPKCSNPMIPIEETDLIEDYIRAGQENGAKIELITDESDEGALFLKAFGGIGAILRYT